MPSCYNYTTEMDTLNSNTFKNAYYFGFTSNIQYN